jgi:CDP-diacylglycerol--serine O-phosphatidyltransferase
MNRNGSAPRRGIYILPNLFTTGALFAGFYAIVQAMNGNFDQAPVAIFVAMVFDGLDGRIARWTHTESDFGVQYDSLSDMISFGLAPSLVMYEWALTGLGKVGWLAAFLYAAAAALRLARFNAQSGEKHEEGFTGLPSPSAAAVVAGFVWAMMSFGVPGREISVLALLITLFAAGVMVSNISYWSPKGINLNSRVSFLAILVVVLGLVLISLDPPRMLFAGFMTYAFSGPFLAAIRAWKRHHGHEAERGGQP